VTHTATGEQQPSSLDILTAEAAVLRRELAALPAAHWELPTGCAPWSVRELFGHIHVVLGWLPRMLDAAPSGPAKVGPREYYRPDGRFAPGTNEQRIALAVDHAARHDNAALLAQFARLVDGVVARCAAEPPGRTVQTRHGDVMALDDFLATRVVEVAVHGLDLALALDRAPWTTAAAGELVLDVLVGRVLPPAALGWDATTFLLKVTGRVPLRAGEQDQLDAAGIVRPSLG